MAITTSLLPGTLPGIKIVLPGSDLTAAAAWTLTGSGAGLAWTVRGGSGTGAGTQVVLVDTLAPINVVITYTLTVADVVADTDTITRTYAGTGGDGLGRDVVANLIGTTFAGVRRLPGDSRGGMRRYHASNVAGARYMPLRLDPVAGAGGGSLQVASVGSHTTAMGALLDSNEVLAYYHDTSVCDLPGCPVPGVDIVYVTSESSDVGVRRDIGEREWTLAYLLQADPTPDLTNPLSDWDEVDAAAMDWDDVDALAQTWDEWDASDVSEIGA